MWQAGEILRGDEEEYELLRVLGEGGFGITWLATRGSDGKEVVVKKLRVERLDEWKAVELFEREAKVLSQLDHPRIPDYLDYFTLGDGDVPEGFALVQEFVDGKTLRELWQEGVELSEAESLRWLFGLLEVLEYLHGLDPPVIHRDISPNNIILRESDGAAFLIDFGTVQARLDSAREVSSTAAGTFGYAAMEQFVGRATPGSDLYGLAMTYLAMHLREEPESMPFSQVRVQIREATREDPLDARLTLVLEEMTEPDPARRPQSAGEVMARLQALRPRVTEAMGASPGGPTAQQPGALGEAAEAVSAKAARWIRARERRLAIDGQELTFRPSLRFFGDPGTIQVGGDGSTIVHVTYDGVYLIDTATMVSRQVVRTQILEVAAGVSDDGRVLVAVDSIRGRLHVERGGELNSYDVSLPSGFEAQGVAVSPTGEVAAVTTRGFSSATGICVFDLRAGALVQELSAPSNGMTPKFSPTGEEFYCGSADGDGVWVYHSGSIQRHDDLQGLAFSPDGRLVALMRDNRLWVGEMDDLEEFRWAGEPREVDLRRGGVAGARDLRFSPKGDRLILRGRQSGGGDTLVVIDVLERVVLTVITDLLAGSSGFRDIEEFGILADGDRVALKARFVPTPMARGADEEIGVFSISSGECLGVLRSMPTSYRAASRTNIYHNGKSRRNELDAEARARYQPIAVEEMPGFDPDNGRWSTSVWETPQGYFGRADASEFLTEREPLHPLERPEVARRLVAGEEPEAVLTAEEQLQIEDLAERIRFGRRFFRHEVAGRPWHLSFVSTTVGLTELLPKITWDARQIGAGPRFGGDDGSARQDLTEQHLLVAATTLKERSAEEREVIFEEMIAAIEEDEREWALQKARRKAERAAKARRAAPDGGAAAGGGAVAGGGESAGGRRGSRGPRVTRKSISLLGILVLLVLLVIHFVGQSFL